MDPSQNQGNQGGRGNRIPYNRNPAVTNTPADRPPDHLGNDPTLDGAMARDELDSRNQAAERTPQYSDGFTVIPPIESRRNTMKQIAQKGEENLQTWREAHRVSSVHETPERLGGNVSLAEARQKQFVDHRNSKLQKKLKKMEMDKRTREEEEEANQRKRDEQRKKAERLVEKRRLEEQSRREQLQQDHFSTTEDFLQRLERRAPMASTSATHTSSTGGTAGIKQEKSLREQQVDHRRVNFAFLDKLEGRDRESASEPKSEDSLQMGSSSASEGFKPQVDDSAGQHLSRLHLEPDLEQNFLGWEEDNDPQPECEWALMKLMSNFPDCSRAFLEDILDQCNGDYQQAHTLLS